MMKDRCPVCGALLLPDEKVCPRCGSAVDPEQTAEAQTPDADKQVLETGTLSGTDSRRISGGAGRAVTAAENMPERSFPEGDRDAGEYNPATGEIPRTIEELKAYCAYHEMQLGRMRFFIGEDYKYPRAFGIYQDGDRFVVYKNKASGDRAVRYQGPDEAYAVRELYSKLLDECHARNIWPDGKPQEQGRRRGGLDKGTIRFFGAFFVFFIILSVGFFIYEHVQHSHDGYYRMNDSGMYYRYGSDWYYSDGITDWYMVDMMMNEDVYDDYYLGDDYNSSWGYEDFHDSQAWESIREEERHTTSSDYDSWDSSSTNWDSDW